MQDTQVTIFSVFRVAHTGRASSFSERAKLSGSNSQRSTYSILWMYMYFTNLVGIGTKLFARWNTPASVGLRGRIVLEVVVVLAAVKVL